MEGQVGWTSVGGVLTNLLDGNPIAIAVAIVIAFGLPVLLHMIFFRAAASPPLRNFLLLGPSGGGKTALFSLLESKSSRIPKPEPLTHTSQTSTLTTVALPATVTAASNRYRSVNDSSLLDISKNPVRYRVRDTPGHGKLRESQGLSQLREMTQSKEARERLRAVVFMVDAAALSEEEALRDTATYLHDVLFVLQKRALDKGKSAAKVAAEVPVLVAANKQDLFTALPAGSVREKLEAEIERVRKFRSKGLMDASAGSGETGGEDEILGNDEGQEKFTFKLLEDEVGSNAERGSGVRKWEEWIGMWL
ncbi:hypothetical protein ASPZODRAFT_173502 [Penicilliopsis zonata CBS 506.65]|uniref:Signal recognition particle receptor subunit beta n=1 Tax=Penicilliopsis zonata CBS 506.65 TaxID=1073090 RepID=A0A1L9STP3_9EURO|nr:hypothetical protein ASPZODRAFT_173502 [Penicilliopsis zonata CBS 506.65]OJJ50457.1 hypothetical protein ASPZODRAFT_173502 [Penicilliopsis zonata CBS 506.65]